MEFLKAKVTFVLKKIKTFKASCFSLSVDSYDIIGSNSFILQLKFVYIRV